MRLGKPYGGVSKAVASEDRKTVGLRWSLRAHAAQLFGKPGTSMIGWLLVLLLICAVSLWLRNQHIDGSLPYPTHPDEGAVMKPAANILKTGHYHPGRFIYPSLPIYLAAGGLGVGFIRAAAKLEVQTVEDIGSVSYPYYSVPTIAETARRLFAVFSVVAIAATGAVSFCLLQRPGALVLAPLILTLSPFFFLMSWRYVNVDIVGTCFVALAVAAALRGTHRPGLRWLVVVPAICAGLAAGSKYIYCLVLVPVCLSIWLFSERGRRLDRVAAAVLIAGVVFVATSPYAVLDLPAFLGGLAYDAYHYASGHPGYEDDPGWGKLIYYGNVLAKDFGVIALGVALLGLVTSAISDWRRTLILVSFPLVLFALLASQRVEFPRNILPMFPLFAVLVGAGIYGIAAVVNRHVVDRWMPGATRRLVGTAVVPLAFVGAMAGPSIAFPDQVRVPPESRVEAVAWIEDNVPLDWAVVVPNELGLDVRRLNSRGYDIRMIDFKSLDSIGAIESLAKPTDGPVVVLVPRWGFDPRFPGEEQAAALNEAADDAGMKVLQSFGGRNLKFNYPVAAPTGRPAVEIRLLNS